MTKQELQDRFMVRMEKIETKWQRLLLELQGVLASTHRLNVKHNDLKEGTPHPAAVFISRGTLCFQQEAESEVLPWGGWADNSRTYGNISGSHLAELLLDGTLEILE